MTALLDADALADLALGDLNEGRLDAAEANSLRALNINRRNSGALTVLGMVLHSRGRHEDAVRVFNALTQYEPADPTHWENLGVALRPTEHREMAIDAYERALALAPATPSLLYNIGLLHMDRCDFGEAYAALKEAVRLAPRDGGIRCIFAQCCYDLIRFEEAIEALDGWESTEGLTAEMVAQVALLLVSLGESRRAGPALQRASEQATDGSRASLTLVRLLERVNRLTDARTVMERLRAALPAEASDPDLLAVEAALEQREGDHEQARQLLSSALERQHDFNRRYHLLFPLAKSLDALGRYDDAYATLAEAHRSQLAFLTMATGKSPSDPSPTMALTMDGCVPQDVQRWQDSDAPAIESSPVFIVGFPRSGTTLLEQILDAHPLLKSMDEQPYLKRSVDDVIELGVRYPSELSRVSSEQLQRIRERYWERVRRKIDIAGGQRLVDKNPLNLVRLPLIRRLFPAARIVLAIRHPCDTLLSCYMQQFRAPDLALMCRDLGALAASYRRAFDFWYEQAAILAAAGHCYELKYESLVTDFDAETRRLSEFLQLPWHEAMLTPGNHAREKGFISTPSYSQVIQPITARSVDRWRNYAGHLGDVLPMIGSLAERWGYAL